MKVKCPVIFERLRHQVGESSIGAQFSTFHLSTTLPPGNYFGRYWKPAYCRLNRPDILKSTYSTFASPRLIILGIFIVFVSGDFSPLTYINIYIAPVEFECVRFSRVEKLVKFSFRSYKTTFCRQPAVNRILLPYCLQPDCYLVCRQADICFVFVLLW